MRPRPVICSTAEISPGREIAVPGDDRARARRQAALLSLLIVFLEIPLDVGPAAQLSSSSRSLNRSAGSTPLYLSR